MDSALSTSAKLGTSDQPSLFLLLGFHPSRARTNGAVTHCLLSTGAGTIGTDTVVPERSTARAVCAVGACFRASEGHSTYPRPGLPPLPCANSVPCAWRRGSPRARSSTQRQA